MPIMIMVDIELGANCEQMMMCALKNGIKDVDSRMRSVGFLSDGLETRQSQ